MSKMIVSILNKLPMNGWKTEIGLVGLAAARERGPPRVQVLRNQFEAQSPIGAGD